MDVYNINSKNIKLKNIGFELKRKSTTIESSILIIQTHSQQFVIKSNTCYLFPINPYPPLLVPLPL